MNISQTVVDGGNRSRDEDDKQQVVSGDDSTPAFDRREMLERLGGREELLGRFIDMFTRNVSGYVDKLQTALEQGDCEQVRLQAHTIKGAAANISARRLRKSAIIMENFACEGRLDDAVALLPRLKNDFAAFQHEVLP
jgi:HPt (histidine-containing phosphotransfer) domain-containing protein